MSIQSRSIVEVAVGILLKEQSLVLMGKRPSGKPYAGYWEFPGGKLEANESITTALERELYEELGIRIVLDNFI
ncbi:MAG: NUDIX domain-containing protein [Burkholderiaceae bacterium]|nr:NUDIX domain-containing protein [Burkholderiaceae bacterium]